MTAQVPNMQEQLSNGVIGVLADIFREFRYGGQFDNEVRNMAVQPFGPVAGAAAVTFANLGLPDASHTLFTVLAMVQATGAIVASSVHTTTGFTLAAGANVSGLVINGGQFCHVGAVASDAITLPSAPDQILDVVATVGTSAGRKTLIIDSNANRAVADGQVIWDGTTGLRFSAADAVTQARIVSTPDTIASTSLLQRLIGQRD